MKKIAILFMLSAIVCAIGSTISNITLLIFFWDLGVRTAINYTFLNWEYWAWLILPICFYFWRNYVWILILGLTYFNVDFFYDVFFKSSPSFGVDWRITEITAICAVLSIVLGYIYFVLHFSQKFKHHHEG